ncbi:Methylated-DNA--protein-cysteine methyltransferase [Candidatus Entotheonellaceae bacterium PAL068K]
MNCHQVQAMLDELTLPRLRAGKYTALHLHVQRCSPCRQVWDQWRHHEQQLTDLFVPVQAPAGVWEDIMSRIEAHASETTDSLAALSQAIVINTSARGVESLALPQLPQEGSAPDAFTGPEAASSLAARARQQLAEYMRGERVVFQLPVDLHPCSDFERAVLAATAGIPYGETRSYKWIAEHIGRPKASRAVGNALHNNPVPVIIPCHRVVKSNGQMGGYALGEAWKTRLLTLEQHTTPFIGCSSTRIVCYRGCHHERRVRADNRIHFAYVDEAIQNGYCPCTVCQPGDRAH